MRIDVKEMMGFLLCVILVITPICMNATALHELLGNYSVRSSYLVLETEPFPDVGTKGYHTAGVIWDNGIGDDHCVTMVTIVEGPPVPDDQYEQRLSWFNFFLGEDNETLLSYSQPHRDALIGLQSLLWWMTDPWRAHLGPGTGPITYSATGVPFPGYVVAMPTAYGVLRGYAGYIDPGCSIQVISMEDKDMFGLLVGTLEVTKGATEATVMLEEIKMYG